jgi:glycerol kinase
MKRYVLALDQGTTSSRAIVFDRQAGVVRTAQQEFRQIYPQPGWVEHDPEEIWSSQLAVMRRVLQEAGIAPAELAAIGIANQRETTILWDRHTGEPVHNAIVWQDRRTAARCEALRAAGEEGRFRARTGLMLDPYFSGTKLEWLLDNVPGVRARAERGELAFGTVDSWLVWKLTGGQVHVTDTGNAARTLFFDIHRLCWDEELLGVLKLPPALLPRVVSSSEVVGQAAASLLGEPIPIAGIAGDQQAATFGQACLRPGMAKNTYGTGCFMLLNTGRQPVASANQLLTTVGWTRAGATEYMLEGSVFSAGATVQWLRDGLGLVQQASEVEGLAASVPDNGDVYLVPAFAGLGAPHWDPYARAVIIGLTRGSGRAHIARAALEAIAYQSAELLAAMQKDAGMALSELRVDGGAACNDWLMQFQADVLGVPVLRPRVIETTALGAAYQAGLAVGFWSGLDEVERGWQADRHFLPRTSEVWRTERLARWAQAVERARGWAR